MTEAERRELRTIADDLEVGKITMCHISPEKAECDRIRRLVVARLRESASPVREELVSVNRLLNKIANLIDDEDTCDPLDDAIKWANEALAVMSALYPPASEGLRAAWPRVFNVTRSAVNTWHGDISFARSPTDSELKALEAALQSSGGDGASSVASTTLGCDK